jgi:integrase
MAWLDRDPSGNFHIGFRLGSRKFKRSLRTKNERSANASCARVEVNIRLIEMGRLERPPSGVDVAAFLLSDGKLSGKLEIPRSPSLADLFSEYRESLPVDSLEPETLRIASIHLRHVERVLGTRLTIDRIGPQQLQDYVLARSKQPGHRGKSLSTTTIKKELSTFSTVWTWALTQGYVKLPFPNQSLRFPKTSEKPPFQTWSEIESQIRHGGLDEQEQAELWDCLFLTLSEIDEVLEFVKRESQYDFLYPMVVLAAHTGARRSELVRSRVGDVNFSAGKVLIREKKRVKGRRTTRQVPLSLLLAEVLSDWFAKKRASAFTFPRELKVSRDRKPRQDEDAVSVDEASHHLAQTFAGSKWQKIRGWHVFRHSFISNCAAKGIDQRMIDRWSGHQTDEMRKRYTHLFPDSQRQAIQLVFGGSEKPEAIGDSTDAPPKLTTMLDLAE